MKRKWLIGLGFVGVLMVGVAVIPWLLNVAPAPAHLAVVKDFYVALNLPHDGDDKPRIDVGRAFGYFHSDLQRTQNLAEFEDRGTDHAIIINETNRQWFTNIENDTATVEGRFTVEGDKEVASALFWLSKENDIWKIVAFRIEDELGSFTGGTIPGSE